MFTMVLEDVVWIAGTIIKALVNRAKETFKKLWKNINWISAAKETGKFAFSLATGTAPIAILSSVLDVLKGTVSSQEKVESSIEAVGGFLENSSIFEDTSCNKEFAEFQENFDRLLTQAGIGKLVVLIDDLDRCLPSVAIEVLEAMRLFMFNKKTAFVIAADEVMIRYAVKKHFPDISQEIGQEDRITDYGFSDKYLEKLIQVPFRIPSLGVIESRIYIMLLLVGSKLNNDAKEYKKLVEKAIDKLKKPWDVQDFTASEVQEILGSSYTDVNEEVEIAIQIREILAVNTSGNPRKIKRFINMLLLRYQMSEARGFGGAVRMAPLAKMMLAEYYYGVFYKLLAQHLNEAGICVEMQKYISQNEVDNTVNKMANGTKTAKSIEKKNQKPGEKENAIDEEKKADEEWFSSNAPIEWVMMAPKLSDEDLRPYFFACKETEDYFFDKTAEDKIREIITVLLASEMAIVGKKDDIAKLSTEEAMKVFDLLSDRMRPSHKLCKPP